MKNLSLTIKGILVSDSWLRMILADLPDVFTRDDLLNRMTRKPWPGLSLNEAIRPILQHLKRKGVVVFRQDQKCWMKSLAMEQTPSQTLPLETISSYPILNAVPLDQTSDKGWMMTTCGWLVSACIIGALMVINAGFAWNLTESSIFRFAFTIGFLGLDGLRPLLMALALGSAGLPRSVRALALLIALGLAPASVMSSTSVVSSALILGAETRTDQAVRLRQLNGLQSELTRLNVRVSQVWSEYEQECKRGGCGKISWKLKKDAQNLEEQIRTARDQQDRLEATRPASTFASRTVGTLEAFGLRSEDTAWIMPVFLALTLEIAALFGPALVLTRKK